MTETRLEETFHDRGVRALLTAWQQRCLFQVAVERRSPTFAERLRCHVLLQPCDSRGLPTGNLMQLADEGIHLRQGPKVDEWIGHLWLPPGIGPTLARQCYYRLLPA